jgi:putative holliday junction resolvase
MIGMKYIGLDYGSKKCGLAVSDDIGTIAVPLEIVPTENIKEKLAQMLENTKFRRVIVGESTNSAGAHNDIFQETDDFVNFMRLLHHDVEFIYEKEFMSSKHARSEDGKKEVDDRAAALVLQRYLDRENMKNRKEDQEDLGTNQSDEEILEEYE